VLLIQGFPVGGQTTGVKTQPPRTAPEQVSVVHGLLSLQLWVVDTHPVAEAHVHLVQLSDFGQTVALYWQPPAGHESIVHALESLHFVGPVAMVQ